MISTNGPIVIPTKEESHKVERYYDMTKKPKQLQKHLLLLMMFLFGTFIFSCENDEILIEEKTTPVISQELDITVVNTTFAEAGEKFNQIARSHNLESHKKLFSYAGIEKSNSSGGIVIISEEVKEIKRGDYTSYTMLIEPKDIASNIFYNLTIEEEKGVTKLFITKYDPTDAWLQNNNMRFEGQITTFRINDLQTALDRIDTPIMSGTEGGGMMTYPTDCDGTVVATLVIEEVRCGCGDGMADNCTGCNIPPYFPYYDYKFVYECIPNSPPPNGNPFTNPPGGVPSTPTPPSSGGSAGNPPSTTSPAGNNPSLTAPIPPNNTTPSSSPPCITLKKNTSDDVTYKQKFRALNTPANYNKNHETGFFKVGSSYVDGVPNPTNHSIIIPQNAKNGTHVHNNQPKTYISNGQAYDGAIKMLSIIDLRSMIRTMQPQNADAKDTFVAMLSNEGIFAITILEPIEWNPELRKKLETFEKNYKKDVDLFITNYNGYNATSRKNFLTKLFLKGLKDAGLNNKIGLFEGVVETGTDTNINNYKINWTRKTLKSVTFGYNVISEPCN
ncbi:hypothetical protein ACI6PS_07285 [Flavobacterium sp. PLA-1-15]|uniref:hypothetical protein n=1 Tax=Flavobacterium sp. PLA-1-15 TaxID=3380533 RepID=UPI003B76B425